MLVSRRKLLGLAGLALPAAAVSLVTNEAEAAPNGTFPTQLTELAVTSISSTQMRVLGRLTKLNGTPLGAQRVTVYSVSSSTHVSWKVLYTDSDGLFAGTMNKVPVGNMVQIEVAGSGLYSRPLPTFKRP